VIFKSSSVKPSFSKFAALVPGDGYIIVSSDDDNAMKSVRDAKSRIITFGIKRDAEWTARDISFDERGCGSFSAYHMGKLFGSFKLNIPGEHNIGNALCSIACTELLGVNSDVISQSFMEFYGTHRRFERKGEYRSITVIDDYAHHPTEIKATLSAAQNYPHKKLWCIFQPHTYSRTIKLLDEFAGAFNNADELILADIYAAREKDTGEISSRMLGERIKACGVNVRYLPSLESIARYIGENASPGDVVITMGAGDIYKVGDMLLGR
jgi:UDP-N-acetylmuramate--alanine ligase